MQPSHLCCTLHQFYRLLNRLFKLRFQTLPNGTMRRSPRLSQGNYNNAPPGRSTQAAAPASGPLSVPQTPSHPRTGTALVQLIRSIEDRWSLGLKIRGDDWSPHKSTTEDIADKVYGQIKRLFFSARPALDAALENFEQTRGGFAHEKQLELLHGILKSKTHSPISRAGTPLNEPPKSLKPSQMCKWSLLLFSRDR